MKKLYLIKKIQNASKNELVFKIILLMYINTMANITLNTPIDDNEFLKTLHLLNNNRGRVAGKFGGLLFDARDLLDNDRTAQKDKINTDFTAYKSTLTTDLAEATNSWEDEGGKLAAMDNNISSISQQIAADQRSINELRARARVKQKVEQDKIDKIATGQDTHDKDMVQKDSELEAIQSKIAELKANTSALQVDYARQVTLKQEAEEEANKIQNDIDLINPTLVAKQQQKIMAASLLNNLSDVNEALEKSIAEARADADKTNMPLHLLVLKRLLQRKKKLLSSGGDGYGLFAVEEDAYNLNTRLINTRQVRHLPGDILLKNQKNELEKNELNINQANQDLTTASRNVQSSDNKVRKKQFILYLLTHTFAFTLMLILVAMLIKNNILSTSIGYKIIGFLATAMVIVLGANYYFNSNRNAIYFEKRDFPVSKEETATAPEKCDAPAATV